MERIRRSHQIDPENLPPFLAIGWLQLLTGPSPTVAPAGLHGHALSRRRHFAANLGVRPHEWRAALWTHGSLILIGMALATLGASLRVCRRWPGPREQHREQLRALTPVSILRSADVVVRRGWTADALEALVRQTLARYLQRLPMFRLATQGSLLSAWRASRWT